jgi:hypothetical protein
MTIYISQRLTGLFSCRQESSNKNFVSKLARSIRPDSMRILTYVIKIIVVGPAVSFPHVLRWSLAINGPVKSEMKM